MDQQEYTNELLAFFKALADVNRLKIIGLLAQEPLSVEQLAEMLELTPSTISHHLARLSKAGLVSARPDSYYNIYQMEAKALEQMAQRLLAKETLPAVVADVDVDAYDKKVLSSYMTPDGKIKAFPMQQKKMQAILRLVVQSFTPGEHYTEKQVNDMLRTFNSDTAKLRRDLVDFGLLKRQNGGRDYWREAPSAGGE